MAMGELVTTSVETGITTVTMDSPANRNALSATMLEELLDALQGALADQSVRAVLLTATGTVFCAGADLKADPGRAASVALPEVLTTMVESPKPVVIRMNGAVRAGGIGLVAAGHVVIAPDDATFAFSEVKIGVVPAVIAVVCRRVMTPRALSRYPLTGEVFSATDAMGAGLVTEVVPRSDLDRRCQAVLGELRSAAPSATAATIGLLDDLRDLDLATGFRHAAHLSAEAFASEDAAEGIAAFREKRPPRWALG
jgi:enoyl-CoA hydratase/carnithine racemase